MKSNKHSEQVLGPFPERHQGAILFHIRGHHCIVSVSPKQQAKLNKLAEKITMLSKSAIAGNLDMDDIDAFLGKIAGYAKPSSLSLIDTHSEEAYGAAMMDTSVAAFHVTGMGDGLGYFSALLDKSISHNNFMGSRQFTARSYNL
eukprot:7361274-Ditylum_brightwellii.AAC.1